MGTLQAGRRPAARHITSGNRIIAPTDKVFENSNNIWVDNCIVLDEDGEYHSVIQRDNVNEIIDGKKYKDFLYNKKIVDVHTGTFLSFDDEATLYNSGNVSKDDLDLCISMDLEHVEVDIFGNPINIDTGKTKEKEKKSFTNKLEMNFSRLNLSINNHVEFWNTYKDPLIDSETTIEKLIKIAFLQPDQFDEIFTIEIDRPESPLMRRFLEKLAVLINEQLATNEEGLDNIDELQKKAYEFADYQGKTLEVVVAESKDYYRHLRYLLTKDEKIVVSESQKNYFDSLVKLNAKKPFLTKRNIDYEVCEVSTYSGICYYREKIPSFSAKSKLECVYFAFVENIRNTAEELDSSNLRLKIALIDDLVTKEYIDKLKSGFDKTTFILVCDRNLNYAKFVIKPTTINKWKKELEKSINLSDFIITNGQTVMPVSLNEYVL